MSENKRNISELYAELGLNVAAYFVDPAWRANFLRMYLEDMGIEPPLPPRTAKRKTEKKDITSKAKRAAKWVSKYPYLRKELLDPLIKQAADEGNLKEVFEAMARGVEAASHPSTPSQFARHVIIAMKCAIRIMEGQNRMPTKQEVREEVVSVFKKNRWQDIWMEDQRWTEVFNAAMVGDLLQGKCEQRTNKHGEHSTAKRMKIARKPLEG